MHYDTHAFDMPVDRRGTSSLKWNKYEGDDIIPLWVADMDFRSPSGVMKALISRVEHGIFGYTLPPKELSDLVLSMLMDEYSWKVEHEWIVWLPGLVTGLNICCRAVGDEKSEVMTTVPVYPPFLTAPVYSRRSLVTVRLAKDEQGYAFDYELIEDAATPNTGMFILCNPYNPVGRVFLETELVGIAEICLKNKMVICSDEIHSGLVLDKDKRHIPIASLDHDIAARTITLMSPSKTFNIPGLGCSFAVIPDKGLRKSFLKTMAGIVPYVNTMGFTAALAAYRDGESWHCSLVEYLRENRDIVFDTINSLPGLSTTHVEGTYLAWIDTSGSGIEDPTRFFELAGVGLSDGSMFDGQGFVRLNFACPRRLLTEALERISVAVAGIDDDMHKGVTTHGGKE